MLQSAPSKMASILWNYPSRYSCRMIGSISSGANVSHIDHGMLRHKSMAFGTSFGNRCPGMTSMTMGHSDMAACD